MQAQEKIVVQGIMSSCQTDSVRIFTLDGVSLRQAGIVPVQKREKDYIFAMALPKIPQGFYFIGNGQKSNTVPLLLGTEAQVILQGNCEALAKAKIANSPLHMRLQAMNTSLNRLQKQSNSLVGKYRIALRTQSALDQIEAQMAEMDQQKKQAS